jgi:hypothetical protein
MKHNKVVVVVGLARGGTNITWNILQSHPQVISTILELSQTIANSTNPLICNLTAVTLGSPIFLLPPLQQWIGAWLDNNFFNEKLRVLDDAYAKQKYEDVFYTREEVENGVLCLKAANREMYLLDLLYKMYGDQLYIVNVVRNGYALCDSWMRRGHEAGKNGRLYHHYTSYMLELANRFPNVRCWKFEAVLADPFAAAEEIYSFAQLEPTQLDKLRLKTKRVINPKGEFRESYGGEGAKHWFSRETIFDLIEPDQSNIQANLLSVADRKAFEAHAKVVLDKLGYN